MHLWRNRIVSTLAIICTSGAIVAGSTLAAPAPAAGPRIFSVWQGDGSIIKVGNDAAGIIGTFGGMAFAVTDDVPMDIGTITCPGIFQLDFKAGTVTGTGGCVFNANDGAQAYGTFDCKGTGEGECTGRFQINGGSGRLASVKGESGFVLRTRMQQIAREPNFVIYETAMGTATWPGLRILLPAQNAQPNTKK